MTEIMKEKEKASEITAEAENQTEYNWIKFSFMAAAAATLLIYLVIPLFFILISSADRHGEVPDFSGICISLMFSQLPVIVLLLFLALVPYRTLSVREKFKIRNWKYQYLLLIPAVEMIFLPLSWIIIVLTQYIFKSVFNTELPAQDIQKVLLYCDRETFLLLAAAAVIVAPLIEELIFRKLLFDYLHIKLGRKSAVCITSFIFASVHLALLQFPALFFMGIILQLIYLNYNSVIPSVMMHILHNSTAVLLILIVRIFIDQPLFKAIFEQLQ